MSALLERDAFNIVFKAACVELSTLYHTHTHTNFYVYFSWILCFRSEIGSPPEHGSLSKALEKVLDSSLFPKNHPSNVRLASSYVPIKVAVVF